MRANRYFHNAPCPIERAVDWLNDAPRPKWLKAIFRRTPVGHLEFDIDGTVTDLDGMQELINWLDRTVGRRPAAWHETHSNVVLLCRHLKNEHNFDADEVIAAFAEPWKWEAEYLQAVEASRRVLKS